MTTINGVHIHPGFFKARREPERPRAGAGASPRMRLKGTVAHKPSSPRAKYAMPVIPIVMAAVTIYGGAALVAVGTTAAMVAGGAMIAGGALVIIGTVTDRPNLVKWGGILSVAGGLGAAYLGLSGALSAADTAVPAIDTSIGVTDGSQLAAENAGTNPIPAETPPPTTPPPTTPPPMADLAGPPATTPPPPSPPPAQQGLLASNPAVPETPAAATPSTPATPSTFTPAQPNTPSAFSTTPPAGTFDAQGSTGVFGPDGTPLYHSPPQGYFDRLGSWVKANPDLAKMGFQATGMLAQSLYPKPTDQAYIDAMTTQARIARMKAGLEPGWWSAK